LILIYDLKIAVVTTSAVALKGVRRGSM
jgi:hypothetical protein